MTRREEWGYLAKPACMAIWIPAFLLPVIGWLILELVERKAIPFSRALALVSLVAVNASTLGAPVVAAFIVVIGRSKRRVLHGVLIALLLFTWSVLCGVTQFWFGTRPPQNSAPGIVPRQRSGS
jgi:hypothetical protein